MIDSPANSTAPTAATRGRPPGKCRSMLEPYEKIVAGDLSFTGHSAELLPDPLGVGAVGGSGTRLLAQVLRFLKALVVPGHWLERLPAMVLSHLLRAESEAVSFVLVVRAQVPWPLLKLTLTLAPAAM